MAFGKKHVEVLGKKMAYIDEGEGDPIVFLHGNPTSSYLWRHVIPHLTAQGRCIAPDLIGMGDSEKLDASGPGRYTFNEHRNYLDELLYQLDVTNNIIFVIHDWGSALGFDWCCRHQEAIQGIAYMEAIVKPLTWNEWPENARGIFQGFRSEAGEEMILDKNLFIEAVLPNSIIRDLTEEEMAVYRAPFENPGEDRRPTLTWPRQIPIEGEPLEVVEIVESYGEYLSQSPVPKLLVNADPGSILTGPLLEYCRTWPNQSEVTVKGLHFIQEDSGDEIGRAVANFVADIRIND
ncbi:MAG: haloalkane dehalogenase [Pseudomonadales bacterium]|jgi:haloalkane dehalogenase|nr:haloalkane dehalogenase [Pseudomonadales bacterium]